VLVDVYDVWTGEAALPGRVHASVYRSVLSPGLDGAAIRLAAVALMAADTVPRERPKAGGVVAYDLRPFIDAIDVREAPATEAEALGSDVPVVTITMTLRHDPEKGVGRPDELLAALADRTGFALVARSLVRERLVLATPAPVEVPAARLRGSRPRPVAGEPRRAAPGPGPVPGGAAHRRR
jgi:hypothetical protein